MTLKLSKAINFSRFYGDMEKRVSRTKPTVEIPPELRKKIKKQLKKRLKSSK